MKKLVLSLFAAISIFSVTSMASRDVTSTPEQIQTMKDVVVKPFIVKDNNDLEMWGCPKGYLVGVKRCWVKWHLVPCGTYCAKIPPLPCCHGEGRPE